MNSQSKTPQDVAEALKAAYRVGPTRAAEVLVDHLGDQVMIVHEPPLPNDGLRDCAQMRRIRLAENPALEKALEGFDEVADIRVDGDIMIVRKTMTGKRRSTGQQLSETFESRFRIKDGRIVEMLAVPQSGDFVLVGEVLREGGFAP